MKRSHFWIVLVVCGVLWSMTSFEGAQTQPFDLRKCQQELEIMKGILRTTLGFASDELAAGLKDEKTETKPTDSFKSSHPKRILFSRAGDFNIGAFYLAGQGAVFTIPTSGVRDVMRGKMAFAFTGPDIKGTGWNGPWLEQLENQINELNMQLRDSFGLESVAAISLAPPSPPAPAAPAVAPTPPAPAPKPAPSSDSSERNASREKQLRQKLATLQDKVKQRSAEEEARQAKFRESLSQLKVFLMEAMANHGDSLTVVKPGEYVNLVIIDEGNRWFGRADDSGDRAQREILSVQKSVITDYKTGKLSMEAFKQKVLNYVN